MSADAIGTAIVDLILDKSSYEGGLREAEVRSNAAVNTLTSGFQRLAAYAGIAFSVGALVSYAKEATMLASRVDTLAVVLRITGENAGFSNSQTKAYVEQVKKMGITTQAAQDSIIKMAQAQMDLSKASAFARVAQDAAVIGNINSSEAFQRMIYGVKSGQTEVLKTMGINVMFEQSYAKLAAQLGRNANSFTEAEKVQARMNAVLEYGTRIQGVYEASMGTAGKAMLSLARYTEELQLKLGAVTQPALKVFVDALTLSFKEAGQGVQDFINSGDMTVLATSIASGAATIVKALLEIGSAMGAVIGFAARWKAEVVTVFETLAIYTGITLVAGLLAAKVAVFGLDAAFISLTGATLIAEAAFASLNAFMTKNWRIMALVTALGAAVYLYNKLGTSSDDAAKKLASFDAGLQTQSLGRWRDSLDDANEQMDRLKSSGASEKDVAMQQKMIDLLTEKIKKESASIELAQIKSEEEAARAKADLDLKNKLALDKSTGQLMLSGLQERYKQEEGLAKRSSDKILNEKAESNKFVLAQMQQMGKSEIAIQLATYNSAVEEAKAEAKAKIDQATLTFNHQKRLDDKIQANKGLGATPGTYSPGGDAALAAQKREGTLIEAKGNANAEMQKKILAADTTLRISQLGNLDKLLASTKSVYDQIPGAYQEAIDIQNQILDRGMNKQISDRAAYYVIVKGMNEKAAIEEARFQITTAVQTQKDMAAAVLAIKEVGGQKDIIGLQMGVNSQDYIDAVFAEIDANEEKKRLELLGNNQVYDAVTAAHLKKMDYIAQQKQSEADFYGSIMGYERIALDFQIKAINERAKAEKAKNPNDKVKQAAIDIKAAQDTYKAQYDASKKIISNIETKFDMEHDGQKQVIEGTKQMLDASMNLYSKESKEYQVLSAMKKAALIAEQMLILQKNVAIISGLMAEAASITMKQTSAVTSGVGAILEAGKLPPPAGFAAIAAMIGVVTSVLSMAGIAFGGGSSASTPSAAYGVGTTRLGGANNSGSESIGNAWKLLEDTYDLQKHTLTGIYENMKQLNANITGIVKAVVLGGIGNLTSGQLSAGTSGINTIGETAMFGWAGLADQLLLGGKLLDALMNIPIVGSLLSGLGSFLSGGSGGSQNLLAQGLNVSGGSVSPFNVVHTAGVNPSWGFGGRDPFDTRNQQASNSALTAFFYGPNGLSTTISAMFGEVAKGLGSDADKAKQIITDAFLNMGDIDLMGADTPEKIQAAIMAAVSKLEDIAAQSIFGEEFINKYIKTNEAAAETVMRLYIDLQSVTDILSMTGKSATSATIDLSESLINLAGGLDKLQESANTYYDKFFNDEEKQARLQIQLSTVLTAQNMVLPSLRDGYRKLIEGLDLNTDAGQKAYITLLSLAGSADTYYTALENVATAQAEVTQGLKDQSATIVQWLADLNRSPLSPSNSMEAVKGEYERLKGLASGAGATSNDTSNYLNFAKEYLTYMRLYGGDYKSIYESVIGDAGKLKTGIDLQIDLAQKQLDALILIQTNTAATAAATAAASPAATAAATEATKVTLESGAKVTQAEYDALPWRYKNQYGQEYDPHQNHDASWETIQFKAGGGYANSPSIFGEAGGEWAVPTYEPQRNNFLKSAPKAFWDNLGLNGGSNGPGGEQVVHIHIHNETDGREVSEIVAKYIPRSGVLTEAIRAVK